MAKIHIKVITHEKIVYEGDADSFYTDTLLGREGILPDHMPITSVLDIGSTKIINDGNNIYLTTMGGVMHFEDNNAVILTDVAELGQDIDLNRANEAMERAKTRLDSKSEEINIVRAQIALRKALARINVKGKIQ